MCYQLFACVDQLVLVTVQFFSCKSVSSSKPLHSRKNNCFFFSENKGTSTTTVTDVCIKHSTYGVLSHSGQKQKQYTTPKS